MILNYIGGARDVAIKDLSEQELVEQVHADALKTILKPARRSNVVRLSRCGKRPFRNSTSAT